MSVIIKDMKMPLCCDDCCFYNTYDYPTCCITNLSMGYKFNPNENRMPYCPLIEVPPHGRLIDADLITNYQMTGKITGADGSDWGRQTYVVLPIPSLSEIPTVLEADLVKGEN